MKETFEQAPGVGDGQGSLACCSPWGRKEPDTAEWLNWTELRQRNAGSSFPRPALQESQREFKPKWKDANSYMKTHESIKLNWKGRNAWNKWKVESFTEETEDAKTVQVKILEWENTIAKINTINTNKYNSQNKNISGCAQ